MYIYICIFISSRAHSSMFSINTLILVYFSSLLFCILFVLIQK